MGITLHGMAWREEISILTGVFESGLLFQSQIKNQNGRKWEDLKFRLGQAREVVGQEGRQNENMPWITRLRCCKMIEVCITWQLIQVIL